ncbi:MAG: RNA-binding protein [Anaerolineales bacterium]|nr:RNA-binding protein [Anaerolineales bacterium]
MAVKLYVANLAQRTTAEDLRIVFAQAGAVTTVDLAVDHATGKSRGFGFVVMESEADAQNAIRLLHGFALHDCEITVSPAKAREAPRRFGDRGGAFGQGGGRPPRSHGRRGGNRRY